MLGNKHRRSVIDNNLFLIPGFWVKFIVYFFRVNRDLKFDVVLLLKIIIF